MIRFRIVARDGEARRGVLETPRGPVETPVFMPVGSAGAVKTLAPRELEALGAGILLANTYHLYLRPGPERVRRLGGLHRFMGWRGALLTDSGGFQVYSLGEGSRDSPGRVEIGEEGVAFRSHLDGSRHLFTPERAVAIQESLGADVIMAFDECPPARAERSYHEASLARTQRWLLRCREALGRGDDPLPPPPAASPAPPPWPRALFGIAQGGLHPDLRRRAIEEAGALDLPGYALGGYAVGEAPEEMWEGVARDAPLLPAGKPRYLMGVGTPRDLLEAIGGGVDMFDCVLPTRCARNGLLFTGEGRLVIKNAAHADDERPVEEACACEACRGFSRAYLRHLFMTREILGLRLATSHNLHHYLSLLAGAREAIARGRFAAFREERLRALAAGGEKGVAPGRETR